MAFTTMDMINDFAEYGRHSCSAQGWPVPGFQGLLGLPGYLVSDGTPSGRL